MISFDTNLTSKLTRKYTIICDNFVAIQAHDGFWLFLKVYYGQHVTMQTEKYNNRGRLFHQGRLNTSLALLFFSIAWSEITLQVQEYTNDQCVN